MNINLKKGASLLPASSEPGARGTDAGDLARVVARMDELGEKNSRDAKDVTDHALAEVEGVEAEAELLAEINAEARAIEMDNHARITKLLLKNTTYGAGAFVLGKLLFGRAHSRKEGK